MRDALQVEHLGASGLRVRWPDGGTLVFDPPESVQEPVVVTWSEQERTAGVRAANPGALAAHPTLLRWLNREGTALGDTDALFAGFKLRSVPYQPIPWATPTEAVRKTLCGLRAPRFAAQRLAYTLRRPADPPLVVEAERVGVRVLHLGQALHRFQAELAQLAGRSAGADLLIAGSDFDDEAALAAAIPMFQARTALVIDTVGFIRRRLGLPTRPLSVVLATAPPGTLALDVGDRVDIPVTRR